MARQRSCLGLLTFIALTWSVTCFVFPAWPRSSDLLTLRWICPSLLTLAPQAAQAAAPDQFDSAGLAQIALLLLLLFLGVAVFTFAKPEEEDWQKEIDAVMTEEEWKRSDGPSICQRCGMLILQGYCQNCSGWRF
eukprot:s164_g10.t1